MVIPGRYIFQSAFVIAYLEVGEFQAVGCGNNDYPVLLLNFAPFGHLEQSGQRHARMRTVIQAGQVAPGSRIGDFIFCGLLDGAVECF